MTDVVFHHVDEGDLAAARDPAATVAGAGFSLYARTRHLFADPSLPGYDPPAADLALRRVGGFPDGL